MSRFFKLRNSSGEDQDPTSKAEIRYKKNRGSADFTSSTKYLTGSPLSCYNEQLPPCLTTANKFFSNPKPESPLINSVRSAQVSRIVHTSHEQNRPNTAPAG